MNQCACTKKIFLGLVLLLFLSIGVCSAAVEIEINATNTLDDDYVTWSPTRCRIRATKDMTVVLTNDKTEAPPGMSQPLDGDVSFAKKVDAGATATDRTLELTLKKNEWKEFFVAGRFPSGAKRGRASSRDNDTVIEVHKETEVGRIIGRHRLMVRVRKNLALITDHERHRLLSAIARLHKNGKYEKYVEVHDWASRGDRRHIGLINHPDYDYPDTSHRGSNFLAWHRIDLLQFERDLQQIHPDVSLHYWKLDHGDPTEAVFSPDCYGANEVDTKTASWPVLNRTPYIDFVRFARDNPLFGWRITYQGRFANSELLTRWPINRKIRPWLLGQPVTTPLPGELEILTKSDYIDFTDFFENDTHNKSHHWMGPPMRDCTVAPADPFFWSFHSWFDRVWAKWQWKYDRFAIDGSNNSYEPLGKFDPNGNPTHRRGHYLEDTMWPWDGETGEGTHADPEVRYKQSRPPKAPIGKFPQSAITGHWPPAPAKPRVMDAIDYLGVNRGVLPHGVCYDDLPFGVATADERVAMRKADETVVRKNRDQLEVFLNESKSLSKRTDAANSVRIVSGERDLERLLETLKNDRVPECRAVALRLLCSSRTYRNEAMTYALGVLREGQSNSGLREEVLRILEFNTHFVPKDYVSYADSVSALKVSANDSSDRALQKASLAVLVGRGDVGATEFVRSAVKRKDESVFSQSDGLSVLALNGGSRNHHSLVAPFVGSTNPWVAMTALLNSSMTLSSQTEVKNLLTSKNTSEHFRLVALHALSTHPGFANDAIELIGDPAHTVDFRREVVALLRYLIDDSELKLTGTHVAKLTEIAGRSPGVLGDELQSLSTSEIEAK